MLVGDLLGHPVGDGVVIYRLAIVLRGFFVLVGRAVF
jgi:hypothetical protein